MHFMFYVCEVFSLNLKSIFLPLSLIPMQILFIGPLTCYESQKLALFSNWRLYWSIMQVQNKLIKLDMRTDGEVSKQDGLI